MTAATEVVVGLDLGTTSSKALVRDLTSRQAALVETRTPWTTVHGGTETTAQAMLGLAVDLLCRAVQAAEQRVGRVRVLGVGVAGLGESGVLLDAAGEPCAPVVAWFDQRGAGQVQQVAARAAVVPEQFARRTGLPWDCQASLAKLLWLQSTGLVLAPGHRWASVPEWVVHRLGGCLIREPSLASRTGLVDQSTGALWEEGVSAAGLPTTLLPPPVTAGVAAGSLHHVGLAPSLQGAALTVAGHDHPVAAIGVGAVGPDELFNSSGTAHVVARSLPGVLDDDRRELLVRSGLSAGAQADVWAAATRSTAGETRALIARIDAVVGRHRRAVACGGWTRMDSVRAAKRSAIAHLQFSALREPGVVGAALLAGQAAGVGCLRATSDVPHDDPISTISGGDS